jgi:hypothetical protein
MKLTRVCLLAILACSCRKVADNPVPRPSGALVERQEEVRKIISSYLHYTGIDIVRGPLTVREVHRELSETARSQSSWGSWVIPGGLEWKQLKAKLKQGDELWFYKTDLQSWGELRGRAGYVAIRGNEVIGSLLTFMN